MEHFIQLLGLPLLSCVIIVGILGYLGIHVLKREVIFVDIALAQMAVVGAIIAHLVFHAHGESWIGYACGTGAVIAAAAFYSFARKAEQIPLEAVIGISYAIAAAATLFLVGIAPGGHIHVHGMLAGSILWTTWAHVAACIVVFAAAGLGLYLCRKPFHRISEDYQAALCGGVNVAWWDFLFYVFVGIVIALATRIAGVVLVFGFLIVPATVSAMFSSRWGARLLIAWSTGILASIMGLIFAHKLDFSVGPSVAMFLGIILILAAVSLKSRPIVTISLGSAVCLGFIGLLFLESPSAAEWSRGAARSATSPEPTSSPAGTENAIPALSHDDVENLIQNARDAGELADLMKKVSDPDLQSQIVCRALDLDPERGKTMALEFLSQEPPLFFRQIVSDKLETFDSKTAGDNQQQK